MTVVERLLGQPLRVGLVRFRNRVISAPMERNLATTDGLATPAYIRYLEARAAGGAALVFTESSYVRADGKARRLQMGMHDDAVIGPLADLAGAVHRQGALLGVELNHGGRTAQGAVNGWRCVAPSAVPCEVAGGEVPEELGDADIRHLVACYGEAAARCARAGVDVVMLHGAHGYLIHQFMSPRTNRRTDAWADPARFLTEVIVTVRRAVPAMALGIRISALEGPPDGLDAEQTLAVVEQAPLDQLDFIDVSAGSYEAGEWIVQPGEWREGVLAPYAAAFRRFGLPVSVVGRITDPAVAEEILQSAQADLITVGRALHADPNWTRAALTAAPFRPCIAANLCIDELFTGRPVPCAVNPDPGAPDAGGEQDLEGRTMVAVGAGPAGLEAARVAATRGARVILLERDGAVGGQLRLATALRSYPAYHRILDWYAAELDRLRIDVRLGVEATGEMVASLAPDTVVVATGGTGIVTHIAGIDAPRVREIRAWLHAGAPDLGDEPHVVWGADREGVAVADHLLALGKRLLVVGSQETLAPEVGRRAKILAVPRLTGDPGVKILLSTRVTAVTDTGLRVLTAEGEREVPAPGPVLVSQGLSAYDPVRSALRVAGYRGTVVTAGDAGGDGGDLEHAISSGARAAKVSLAATGR